MDFHFGVIPNSHFPGELYLLKSVSLRVFVGGKKNDWGPVMQCGYEKHTLNCFCVFLWYFRSWPYTMNDMVRPVLI